MERTGLWDNKGSEGCLIQSVNDQMKVFQETGSEALIGLGRVLMPSSLGMHHPKAATVTFS